MDQFKEQSSSPSKNTAVASVSARTVQVKNMAPPVSEGMGLVVHAIGNHRKKKLNPNAKAWDPKVDGASEDDRCLFLTFSNGYALSKRQIKDFFNRKHGKCVETVDLHGWADPDGKDGQPLFGKVIFKWSCIPAAVMAGAIQVNLVVDKKHLRCKRFHSEKNGSVVTSKSTTV